MRFCSAVEELVGDTNFTKGNSWVPHLVACFSRYHLFDGVPAQQRLIRAASLALNQDSVGTVDSYHVDTVIVLRCPVHRLVTLLLPHRGNEALEIVPFHSKRVIQRDGRGKGPIARIRNDIFDREFSRPDIAGSVQHISSQCPLVCQQLVKFNVKSGKIIREGDGTIDIHLFGLADPIGPVGGLVLLSRIPGPRVMDNVVRRLNVDAEADGNRRKNDDAKSQLRLECLDPFLTAGDMLCRRRRVAVDDVRRKSEHLFYVIAQHPLNFPKFAKDDDLLIIRLNFLKRHEQPGELRRAGPVIGQRFRPEDAQADPPRISADQAQVVQQTQMVSEWGDNIRLIATLEGVDGMGIERALLG